MNFSHPGASFLAPLVLLGWPLVILVLFLVLKARTAVLWSFLVGFLFLPEGGYSFAGLPEYTKQTATSFTVFMCSILLDGGRTLKIRPSWFDVPMLFWCLGRVGTSLSNGLGVYDGLSVSLDQVVSWGIPYWLGRTYFSDREGVRELARGIVIGGLLYLPLCLYELRFSPQLHRIAYGYMQLPFILIKRYGGYRPLLFMQSSLMVAMWMASATVVCTWLGMSGAVKKIAGIPTRWLILPLFATTVACKAFGAIVLMFVGVSLWFVTRHFRLSLPLVVLIAIVGSYPLVRGTGLLSADRILGITAVFFDDLRTDSLGVRVQSEDMYIDHAVSRPLLGWGGWGRGDVVIEDVGRSVPDGLWVIALSRAGWLAVAAIWLLYLAPPIALVRRLRPSRWLTPETAPVAALAVLLTIYWVDCLSNAMINLVLVLAIGAMNGVFATRRALEPIAAPDAEATRGGALPGAAAPAPSLARGITRTRRLAQRLRGGPPT